MQEDTQREDFLIFLGEAEMILLNFILSLSSNRVHPAGICMSVRWAAVWDEQLCSTINI